MQAQSLRANTSRDVLTSQQSLQSIQTLLRAGLGCITYLRNLLPADNFSESYLTSANADRPSESSSQTSQTSESFSADNDRRNVSGFKIMTVTRGYTEEADKLLDYMEKGVFDALQNQYLRSFIFAIYLDNDDPNNIVEAYTFNFRYYSVPGTSATVPVMSLGEDLMRMSLSGSQERPDPLSDAHKKGRVPSLGEVKKSLKSLIKNLIQATTQMDPLPRRRFATFKLFYHDHTPDDYEPPFFRAGNSEKDKWFFTTHNRTEVPEKCSVGSVQTGWHGVDVRVSSVSGYLPSLEDDNAPFLGTTAGRGPAAPALTPAEEAASRIQQAQVQRLDAAERKVVWDAEGGLSDTDADGEEDPTGEQCVLGTWKVGQLDRENPAPIGIRDGEGNIIPVSKHSKTIQSEPSAGDMHLTEGHYIGAQEDVPSRVGELYHKSSRPADLEKTQQLDYPGILRPPTPPSSPLSSANSTHPPTPKHTHPVIMLGPERSSQSLPPSDIGTFSLPSVSSLETNQSIVETQILEKLIDARKAIVEDEEMLGGSFIEMPSTLEFHRWLDISDLETQPAPSHFDGHESIESFSNTHPDGEKDVPMEDSNQQDAVLECECGVQVEDNDLVNCEGSCNKWFHLWCMGYHEAEQLAGDISFICFDCRVRADQNWDLIVVHDLYPMIMERFRNLALFRRAIKVCQTHNPPGLSAFIKLIGCENIVAGQLFKRLESEGFIAQETKERDDLGLMETTTRKSRNRTKDKGGAKRKQSVRVQGRKSVYVFVEAMTTTQAYVDYFSPDPHVEKRILGLSNLKPRRKTRSSMSQDNPVATLADNVSDAPESQSQTNLVPMDSQDLIEDSQTQAEVTQLEDPDPTPKPAEPVNIPRSEPDKRKGSDMVNSERTTKRMKVSVVGLGVDLGD
ncbi:HORMA-domain-containing protein [Cristinia sonorae]|uniref:HORMA-domain-containing protein n=1 Tax=Cristinia sonorae TaxID=1940300 RepID=A0A8K0XV50_9AGAR|nr:HORMA-domain-containing protein [Cristinia sonorae]